jgi:vacuolar-type H+-ATPase catalytic subunit A/Vma1
MKHDKKNENAKRFNFDKDDDVVSNNNRKNVDLDSSFKWNIENDLLRWENKWYILLKFFKRELLKQNHDDSYADYFEHEKTFDLLKRKYLWNNMSKNVKEYVDICSTCHRIKLVRHKSHDMLQSLLLLLLLIILDLTSTLVDSCESIYVRYVWKKNF